jgi:hypothetical protein
MGLSRSRLKAIEDELTPRVRELDFRIVLPANGRSRDPDDQPGNIWVCTQDGSRYVRPTGPGYDELVAR